MKKDKLIEILQGMEGNPEVVLWNGFVNDYNHIGTITEDCMRKESDETLRTIYGMTCQEESRPFVETEYKTWRKKRRGRESWEFPNEAIAFEQVIVSKWYGPKKKVILISMKRRDKSYSDRIGKMYY